MTDTAAHQILSRLQEHITGTVVEPGHPDYDAARRVWNGMSDRHPLAVVRAGSVADVPVTIAAARERHLPLAVRGGGHSVAGHGTVDAGLVLDLSGLRRVEVDTASRTVRVEPGATLGDVDAATEPHGLLVPLGVVARTGVAGLTLGGGIGWATRAHGLSADNLLAADVVTAAGTTVHAGEDGAQPQEQELLWGLRGGGGNFGVVTSLTFRAHPLPAALLAGDLVYAPEQWASALTAYEEWTRDLPDALGSVVSFLVPPPALGLGDDPVMIVGFAWLSDDADHGAQVVDRLRRSAPPAGEAVEPVTWRAWQSAVDAMFPDGSRAYWKNTSFDRLDEEVIEVITRRARQQTWRGTGFDVHHMGGAFGRVPESATPFPNRGARFWLNEYGFWADPADDAARTAFVRDLAADMGPFATGGQYVNFTGEEVTGADGDARRRAVQLYGPEKLTRLQSLKRRWDPDNVFHVNHNIPG